MTYYTILNFRVKYRDCIECEVQQWPHDMQSRVRADILALQAYSTCMARHNRRMIQAKAKITSESKPHFLVEKKNLQVLLSQYAFARGDDEYGDDEAGILAEVATTATHHDSHCSRIWHTNHALDIKCEWALETILCHPIVELGATSRSELICLAINTKNFVLYQNLMLMPAPGDNVLDFPYDSQYWHYTDQEIDTFFHLTPYLNLRLKILECRHFKSMDMSLPLIETISWNQRPQTTIDSITRNISNTCTDRYQLEKLHEILGFKCEAFCCDPELYYQEGCCYFTNTHREFRAGTRKIYPPDAWLQPDLQSYLQDIGMSQGFFQVSFLKACWLGRADVVTLLQTDMPIKIMSQGLELVTNVMLQSYRYHQPASIDSLLTVQQTLALNLDADTIAAILDEIAMQTTWYDHSVVTHMASVNWSAETAQHLAQCQAQAEALQHYLDWEFTADLPIDDALLRRYIISHVQDPDLALDICRKAGFRLDSNLRLPPALRCLYNFLPNLITWAQYFIFIKGCSVARVLDLAHQQALTLDVAEYSAVLTPGNANICQLHDECFYYCVMSRNRMPSICQDLMANHLLYPEIEQRLQPWLYHEYPFYKSDNVKI